ncbi:MAG: hypothetical protein DRI24_08005 [Deltaproteobacteria bacterium]|nr:MAG: hypothetical protein DRI24_08005 [Deltaproteobacteria bacterium]
MEEKIKCRTIEPQQRETDEIQAGRGVNAPGVPEIPPLVFEELLVNALVHRVTVLWLPISSST